jgi:hypothetical protein
MYRARRYWDRFNESDPVTQGIAVAALVLLAIFALPYINFPWTASGGPCTDLAEPFANGTNQSVLGSQTAENFLRLEIVPKVITINPGDPLRMDVRFINASMAPLTLYLPPDTGIFRYTGQESGLLFSVQSADGRVLGEPVNVRPPAPSPQIYSQNTLHVLRPRSRCTFPISIAPNRLQAAGVTAGGQYQITGVYRNQNRGIVPTVVGLTPTPMYPDLGVWTGEVRSDSILLGVGVTPAR